ncbi:MAG TPA: TetR/AcrR family transcriptional regulator [Solimonas sp.]|nr:TetR/AcrR family transcriptional regulator [Solimonas sp.]
MNVGKARNHRSRAAHLGPERRRPQILDAALKLAAGPGLHTVNMESVAQAIGVTKPSVYACFSSREDLLDALLAREEQRLFAGVMAALPAELDLHDPQRLMTEGFRALFRVVEQHADSWRLVLAAENDPAAGERHREARRLVAQRATLLGEAWLRSRGARDIERRLPVLVQLFMSSCEGMVRALLAGSVPGWSIDDLGAYVGRLLLSSFEEA